MSSVIDGKDNFYVQERFIFQVRLDKLLSTLIHTKLVIYEEVI